MLLRNLFESELFQFRQRTVIEPKIIWTRSFDELYDPFAAVKVFEMVSKRYPSASMTMTSNGPLAKSVYRYIRSQGLSGISMTGRVPTQEVARLMNEASICLNTSRHDGLPTALLEAGACGLPIVSTNVGGIPSLFQNGVSAVLVEPGDCQAMADAIVKLIENPEKAVEMGRAAHDAVADYSWDRASAVLAEAYGFE